MLRAQKAESLVEALKRDNANLKRLKTPDEPPAEKPSKKKNKRAKPQYQSRASLEEGLEENYTRTKPK